MSWLSPLLDEWLSGLGGQHSWVSRGLWPGARAGKRTCVLPPFLASSSVCSVMLFATERAL